MSGGDSTEKIPSEMWARIAGDMDRLASENDELRAEILRLREELRRAKGGARRRPMPRVKRGK